MAMESDRRQYSTRSVERVLKVLRSFTVEHPARTYLEVAEETGIPPTTVFRILQILTQEGFLEQEEPAGRYQMGVEVVRLGDAYLRSKPLVQVGMRWLDTLVARAGLSAYLGIRDGSRSIGILGRDGPGPLSLTTRFRESMPLYATALGKALIMYVSHDELAELFSPPPWPTRTPNSISTLEQLRENLQKARLRGCTLDNEEGTLGVRCVGTAIRGHDGRTVAAISVSGTILDITEESLPAIIEVVHEIGVDMSTELGFFPSRED